MPAKQSPFHAILQKLKWLDPFHYVDLFVMPAVNPKNNAAISTIVYIVSAFVFAWLAYTIAGMILQTQSPFMIVVSGSMKPLYHRGDIIMLAGAGPDGIKATEVSMPSQSLSNTPFSDFASLRFEMENGIPQAKKIVFKDGKTIPVEKTGSIVVYTAVPSGRPIIHRVVAKLAANDGTFLLTKGDSEQNYTLDADCGKIVNGVSQQACITLYPVNASQVQGKAIFQIPVLGCAKLWIFDNLLGLASTGRLPADYDLIC
ncbi:MAG: hypothetical protein HY394_05900 [Candidatus Diapherotrites archaeon]|nr:hypothetical protein [Candidatus Diapherotrites archaeon]